MALEKSQEALFGIDESKTTFGSDSTQRLAKCVRWLLLILPTVISLLALVAIIVAIVIFGSNNNSMLSGQSASLQSQVAQFSVQNATLQRIMAQFSEQNASMQMRVAQLEAQLNNCQSVVQCAQSKSTYTRWGSSTCPDVSGTTLVYSGYAGGTAYFNRGGGSNQLCMPLDPEYTLPTESGVQGNSLVYGSEYESAFLGSQNENVPCAVCLVYTRSEILMIPGKTSCPSSWIREYYGYLMSENHGNYRTTFVCVDEGMEFLPNRTGHADACDLWTVEVNCVSMPCPPYDEEKEVGCVVCSK